QHKANELIWARTERYGTDLQAHLTRVTQALDVHGRLPLGLARTIALDLAGHVKRMLNQHLHAAQVPQVLAASYLTMLADLLYAIKREMLLAFDLGDLQVKHKVAMLALGHPHLAHVSKPLPIDVDAQSNEFCVRYYYTGAQRPELVVRSATHIVDPSAEKIRAH